MNGYGVIVKPGKTDEIYSVFLVDAKENADPIDSIKHYCRQLSVFLVDVEDNADPIDSIKHYGRQLSRATLPWPVDCWEEHEEEIEWFRVRDVERLRAIKWPGVSGTAEICLQLWDKVQVYRAFEIKQVTLTQALDALGNEVITRATGLGWNPQGLGSALNLLANAMGENDQAEAYRESIMDMIEDVLEAVEATESIYEYAADEFLEKEGSLESGPKAPKDMTDDELINEATQSYCSIYAGDVTGRVREFFTDTVMANRWGSDEVIRHAALEAELFNRDYEVLAVLTPSSYSVQKREEE